MIKKYALLFWAVLLLGLLSYSCDSEDQKSTQQQAGQAGNQADMINQAGMLAGQQDQGRDQGSDQGSDQGADQGSDQGADQMVVDAYIPPPLPEKLPVELESYLDGNSAALSMPISQGQVRIAQVTDPSQVADGTNIQCRVGCFVLENAVTRFCVQGKSNFSQMTFNGGDLVDATLQSNPTEDRLNQILISPGLGEVVIDQIGIASEGGEGKPVILQVKGHSDGSRIILSYLPNTVPLAVNITNEYHLYPDRSEIEVYTWIQGPDRRFNFKLYDMTIWSDDAISFYDRQIGEFPPLHPRYVGAIGQSITYRWRMNDYQALNLFPIPKLTFNPIEVGNVSGVANQIFLIQRVLEVNGPSISSHPLFPEDAEQAKRMVYFAGVAGAEAYLYQTAGNTLFGHLRFDENGNAEAMLPYGNYRVQGLRWKGGLVAPIEIEVNEQGSKPVGAQSPAEKINITYPAPAKITLNVKDDQGRDIGAKAIFRSLVTGEEIVKLYLPVDRVNQPQPQYEDDTVELPAGSWVIEVTRGWHYSAYTESLELSEAQNLAISVVLNEQIPMAGWTSGEFHQHSTPSLDSEVSMRDRIISNIAEGVGFMVNSDHDVLVDYPAYAQKLDLNRWIATPITGVEISPRVGHLGAYGMTYDPNSDLSAGNAPPLVAKSENGVWRIRAIPEMIEQAIQRGAKWIQVNHPRDDAGYFTTVGYVHNRPISEINSEHWTDKINSVEVYNREGDFCIVLRDWLGLLNQGVRITGVGNSDSHSLGYPVGYPRNYFQINAQNPVALTQDELVTAVKNGKLSVGAGAMIDLPDGPELGSTITGNQHQIRLRIRTPDYNQVTRLVVLFQGKILIDRQLETEVESIVDLDEVITINAESDGALVFLTQGPNMPYISNKPTFAFTNPIWIDANGDGQITNVAPQELPKLDLSFCTL